MLQHDAFYTMKGYQINEDGQLSTAMEDYLEMISRLLKGNTVVRTGELAEQLHVTPSSASKMIQQLKQAGLIHTEKYSYIQLTKKGEKEGNYLLWRHDVIQNFLCALNHSEDELEQVEKIEHFLNKRTIKNLHALTTLLNTDHSDFLPDGEET